MSKVALITGCSEPSSLGAAMALDLQSRGYRVFATARKIAAMAKLEQAGIDVLALDVTSAESIAAALETVKANAGRLDVLVNNAGVGGHSPVLDTDISRAKDLFDVNLWAPLAMIQAFSPLLVRTATETGKRTVVVNIGSIVSNSGPWLGAYGASKAAIQSLSDTLRMEMAPLGVNVITVELGGVRTAMAAGDKAVDVISKTPSGFYSNFDTEIEPAVRGMINDSLSKTPTSTSVAKDIGRAIASASPPGKLWTGWYAWVFRWIKPFMPVRVYDSLFGGMQFINLIKAPVK